MSVPARRRQVAYATSRCLSVRRACTLLQVARSALHYQSRMIAKEAVVVGVMKRLSGLYPRYGYRRIYVFLGREGHVMGEDRAYRIWSQAGLQVPRKRPRKRIANSRPRPTTPTRANEVWAHDFVFDACANGQQLKCLTLVDEYTRECLAIDVAGSIRSGRLIEMLSRVISERGSPKHIRSDNGPEFFSKALLSWAVTNGLDPALIDPGKPWQNGTNESFNGKFRDECLSMEWFRTRAEAKVRIETWRQPYNEVRPHSSLGKQTPKAFGITCGIAAQSGAISQ